MLGTFIPGSLYNTQTYAPMLPYFYQQIIMLATRVRKAQALHDTKISMNNGLRDIEVIRVSMT